MDTTESPDIDVTGLYRLPSGSHILLADVVRITPYPEYISASELAVRRKPFLGIELAGERGTRIEAVEFNTDAEATIFADNLAGLVNVARAMERLGDKVATDKTAQILEAMADRIASVWERLERIEDRSKIEEIS